MEAAAAAAAQEQDGRVLNAFYLNMICIELSSAAKKPEKKKIKNQVRNKKSFFFLLSTRCRDRCRHIFHSGLFFFQFCDLLVLNTFV